MFGMPLLQTEGRHATIIALARHFDYDHLPQHLKGFSQQCYDLAANMLHDLPDSPELALGLENLIVAKDWFVRAAVQHVGAIAKSDELQQERKQGIVEDQARFERVTPENPMGVELPDSELPVADDPGPFSDPNPPLPRDAGLHG